jgi:hypothetical protein
MPYKSPEYGDQVYTAALEITASTHHIKTVVDAGGAGKFDEGAVGFDTPANLYDDNDTTDATYSAALNTLVGESHLYDTLEGLSGDVTAVGWGGSSEENLWDDNTGTSDTDTSNGAWYIRGDRQPSLDGGVPNQCTIEYTHNIKEGATITVKYGPGGAQSEALTAHAHTVTAGEESTDIIFGDPFTNPIPNDLNGRYIFVVVERYDSSQPNWNLCEVILEDTGTTWVPKDAWCWYDRGSPTTIHTPTRLKIPIDHAFAEDWILYVGYNDTDDTTGMTVHASHSITAAEAVPAAITWDFPSMPDPIEGINDSVSRYIHFQLGVDAGQTPYIPELRLTETPAVDTTYTALTVGPEILANDVLSNNIMTRMLSGTQFGIVNGPGPRFLRYRYSNISSTDLETLDDFWETSNQGAYPMTVIPHDDESDTPLSVFVTGYVKEEDSKNPLGPEGETYRVTIDLLENI